MRPVVLVLLVATSALAAPSYDVTLTQESQNAIPRDNSLVGRVLDVIDGGDVSIYALTAMEILKDLANKPSGQPQAYGQAIALLGELSTGRPGDSCAAASYIQAYTTDNPGAIRGALDSYIRQLVNNIDSIVTLINDQQVGRFATGPRGGCAGEGRTYDIDAAWDRILASTSPSQIGLINEEYCTAKRLYCAVGARSNNLGAHITASALPPTVQVFGQAAPQVTNFLRALSSGENPGPAAGAVKRALLSRVRSVTL